MSVVLSVRDVVKTFGAVRAVDGVSFTVQRGTITGLLGRNGAGKTTTIRMITGVFFPDSGSIEWLGSDRDARDRIGYLPEERGLYRQMKVKEHLLFLAEIKGKRGSSVVADAERWLKRFELWDKRDAKVEEPSSARISDWRIRGLAFERRAESPRHICSVPSACRHELRRRRFDDDLASIICQSSMGRKRQ